VNLGLNYNKDMPYWKNLVMGLFFGAGMGIGLGLATDGLIILLFKLGVIKP
jgi:hypothetical protein